ncbi:response regulator [Nocardia sp. NPDC003482]|uniref:response regulator n=1 Tax=Nocardia sp. NPDC004068 TaxID=3364303 RepID=UPI0036AE07A6
MSTQQLSGDPARVLVVEQDPATAEMTLLVLAAAGFEAVSTRTGGQALSAVDVWHPDLVLLELLLPDLPVAEVCARLRVASPAPIMIVSTETDPDVIELALGAGACDYLAKPFRTRELLTRIHTRLGV